MCVLTEIIMFSLWCTRRLTSLMCRDAQKVTLVKKRVSYMYMTGKGVKLIYFLFFLFWFDSCISALTNMKLGREIKLCDLMNTVMVKLCKQCISWKRTLASTWNVYVHVYVYVYHVYVTLWKTKLENLIHG